MKILVLGGGGFVGQALTAFWQKNGEHEVAAPDVDALDVDALQTLFCNRDWDVVVHLAALSFVPDCERDPERAFAVNLGTLKNMLQVHRDQKSRAAVIFPSSALVYAPPSLAGGMLKESSLLGPTSVYGETKLAGEALLKEWSATYGTRAVILRLFNHTHHSQSPQFFVPKLYAALVKLTDKAPAQIPVGNLEVVRDIGSVQDLRRAFDAVVRRAPHLANGTSLYNVSSGCGKRLTDVAQELARQLDVPAQFVRDPALVRAEPASLVGDSFAFAQEFDWQATTPDAAALIAAFLAKL